VFFFLRKVVQQELAAWKKKIVSLSHKLLTVVNLVLLTLPTFFTELDEIQLKSTIASFVKIDTVKAIFQ